MLHCNEEKGCCCPIENPSHKRRNGDFNVDEGKITTEERRLRIRGEERGYRRSEYAVKIMREVRMDPIANESM